MPDSWKDGPCRRLDKLLREAGLSNVAVAKSLGVSDGAVSKWRAGENTPNADTLAAILELCRGSADFVLGLKPQPWDPNDLKSAYELVGRAVGAIHAAVESPAAAQPLKGTTAPEK